MKLISVIVPIYNVEKYLERCIQSIVNQTYKNLEIILVDDGSQDSCGEICDKWSHLDNRIKVIHKVNGGLSDARNVGIDISKGDFIAFVDSDDWLDLDMLDLLIRMQEMYKADIVECSYRNVYKDYIQEETKCTAQIVTATPVAALEAMLDWKYFKPVAWNKIYKRSVIGDVRYTRGKWHEDEYTTYKYIYNASKLIYVDVSKYNYNRTREDSITGQHFKEKNLDACWAFRERVDFFYDKNLIALQEKMNNIYCWYILESANKCFKYNINGSKVNELCKQIKQDIKFFKGKKVNATYIEEMNIIKNSGLYAYGKYRSKQEEKNGKS